MQPKVSIIIPVYNAEPYISRCLNSLITQTFTEIEILCINDGSTDGSLRILNAYAQSDSRIRIISQTNRGMGGARNIGVDAATADYILFIDACDWIEPQSCERLYTAITHHQAEMACGSIQRTYRFRKPQWVELYTEENIYASAQTRFDTIHCLPNFRVVHKMLKREVLLREGVRFKEGTAFEQIEYLTHLLHIMAWMITVPDAIYHDMTQACPTDNSIELQQQSYFAQKRSLAFIDSIGVAIKPEYRWIRKRTYRLCNLTYFAVWVRDGIEEMRLFDRIVIQRRKK